MGGNSERIQHSADQYGENGKRNQDMSDFFKELEKAFPLTPKGVILGEHPTSKIEGEPTLGDKLKGRSSYTREIFLNEIIKAGIDGLFPILRDKYNITKGYEDLEKTREIFRKAIYKIEKELLKSGFENSEEYFINGKIDEEKFNELKSDVSIIGLREIEPLLENFNVSKEDFINISLTDIFEIVKNSLKNNSINISNLKNLNYGEDIVNELENNGIELDWFKDDMLKISGTETNIKTQIAGEIGFRLTNTSWASLQGARAIIEKNPSRIDTVKSDNFKSFDDMILTMYNKNGGGEIGFLRAVYEVAKDFGQIGKVVNEMKGKTNDILQNTENIPYEAENKDSEPANLKIFENVEELKITNEELKNVFKNENFQPKNLITLLEKQYPEIYNQDVNVREGYNLKEHTLMVMNQFEKFFANKDLPLDFDKNIFRLILALHDIGKIEAIAREKKQSQYSYNQKYIETLFDKLNIDYDKDLIITLVGANPIGGYIANKISLEKTQKEIQNMAEKVNKPIKEFFDLLCIYYKVDAGSYTENAGGNYPDPEKPGLDSIFDFNEKNGDLEFSPAVKKKIDLLEF